MQNNAFVADLWGEFDMEWLAESTGTYIDEHPIIYSSVEDIDDVMDVVEDNIDNDTYLDEDQLELDFAYLDELFSLDMQLPEKNLEYEYDFTDEFFEGDNNNNNNTNNFIEDYSIGALINNVVDDAYDEMNSLE